MKFNRYTLTDKQYRVAEYLKQKGDERTAKDIANSVSEKPVTSSFVSSPLKILINAGLVEVISRGCQPDRYKWTGKEF